jgi:hypothetical protein
MAIPTIIRLRSADAQASAHRFDYRGRHRYLVTLPAHGQSAPFQDGPTVARVRDALRDAGIQHKFEVYAYCFLPGRLVMLIRGKEDGSDMKKFLAGFRQASVGPEGARPLWSRKYLERVLRKLEENREIARMIFELPVKEGLVKRGVEYPHMGSFVVVRKSDAERPRPRPRPQRPFPPPARDRTGPGPRRKGPGSMRGEGSR